MRLPWRKQTPDGATSLLVDHWYSHAVGHVIEGLRRCQGYHACDPELRIALVLNRASPAELATCAPFVAEVYGVPYTSFGAPVGSPRRALQRVPRDWDYVVHHPAAFDPEEQRFEGLRRYYEAAGKHFRGRLAVGVAGQAPPDYAPHQQLRLELPEHEREAARTELDGRRSIAVMPAGSGARHLYPSTTSWLTVLDELGRRFPDAAFTLVGRLGDGGGRTASGIARGEVDHLLASRPHAVDAFDRPLLEQLALVEAASVFVSPHTGFGFAALAVGTPWLTLSGGDWHEYFFNGVPFHSVLPSNVDGPVFARGRTLPLVEDDVDGEGPRSATMSAARIAADLDELAESAVALAEGRIDYEHGPRRVLPPAGRGVRRRPRGDRHVRGRPPRLRLTPVKVVMTLLVRDERDIVEQHLAFHFAAGVDEVIVTDHASTDGTEEVLARLRAAPAASASSASRRGRSASASGSRAWRASRRRSTVPTG